VNPASILHSIRPGYVAGLLLILVVSHLVYAFWPLRRRRYARVLLTAAAGVVLGQVWVLLGFPGLQLGDANLVPAIVFAVALQPVTDWLSARTAP
jgi:hypothetical protein